MNRKIKLLITSVGSLVGQNILDSLEDRRSEVEIIGLDSSANNPRNFRCDRVYQVSLLDQREHFTKDFVRIATKENPDLVLAGRDHDVIFLSGIKEQVGFVEKIPYGDENIARMMQDKFLSYQYAEKNTLPFADSCLYSKESNAEDVKAFLRKHSFPLLAKPRQGFGSHGVFYILNQGQLDCLLEDVKNSDVLFQEYLGPKQDFEKMAASLKYGIPLFFQIPETGQFAAQTVISAEGAVAEVFISLNTMSAGRAEYSRRVCIPEIEATVKRYAETLYRDGWYGSLNLQLKQDTQSVWKVFELNPRMTGTTSARYLLGYDELSILTDYFSPEIKLPHRTETLKSKAEIFKYLTDYYLSDRDVEQLNELKIWKRS